MEKITVIVTVYNRLKYVRNIIICLLQQTVNIHELIFADDGSKEDITNYIEDLIPLCKFKIKHVYQEDLGFRLSRSRNNAVRNSEGDYLIFLDQDVIFSEDFIEKIYSQKKEKVIVYTRALVSNEEEKEKIQKNLEKSKSFKAVYNLVNKEQEKITKKAILKDRIYNILYFLKLRKRGGKIAGLMFSLYKKDFIAINGFDEKYKAYGYEDDDFCNRFFKYGKGTKIVRFNMYPIHMYHYFDPTKKYDLNKNYYYIRKKQISKLNFKCQYGYINSIDKDKVILTGIN